MEEILEIPKDLDECREMNTTVQRLYNCAKTIRTIGKVVSVIVLLVGFVWGVVAAIDEEEFYPFVTVFMPMLVSGAGVLAASIITELLFQALASIVYYISVTAKVNLLNASQSNEQCVKGEKVSREVITQPSTEKWECSCGHSNSSLKTVCSRCGLPK